MNARELVQHPSTGERMQRYLFESAYPGVDPIVVPVVDPATVGSLEEQGIARRRPEVIRGRR